MLPDLNNGSESIFSSFFVGIVIRLFFLWTRYKKMSNRLSLRDVIVFGILFFTANEWFLHCFSLIYV